MNRLLPKAPRSQVHSPAPPSTRAEQGSGDDDDNNKDNNAAKRFSFP